MITDIILDLDETLIHGMSADSSKTTIETMKRSLEYMVMEDQSYIIFLRPGVRNFLDQLCHVANVSVWTAASQTYGSFIVKLLFNTEWRKCKAFFHRDHCDASRFETGHLKNLKWLSEKGARGLFPHHSQMVLIDDRRDIMDSNPERAIVIDAFTGDPHDKALDATLSFLKPLLRR